MSEPGIFRFIETDSYGVKTGRALIIKRGSPKPPAASKTTWRIDPTFNVAEELLETSSFKAVIAAVLDNGLQIVG